MRVRHAGRIKVSAAQIAEHPFPLVQDGPRASCRRRSGSRDDAKGGGKGKPGEYRWRPN